MKVLVTGHLGYIGPILVSQLKERGHFVTGLDVGYFRDCVSPGSPLVPPDREILRDIRDIVAGDLEGQEAIIHLCGLSNDPMGELNPQLTSDINFLASLRLARLAKAGGIERFVFASSCSVYGASGDIAIPLDETAMFSPVSAYAISKVETEKELALLADDQFCPVYMRNATAYGLSPRVRCDLVFNNLMAVAHTTGVIRVLSDGTPWRPLVHVADIAQAAAIAAEAPRDVVWNQAFNIGRTDANYQIRDVAGIVAAAVPGARVEITGETGGDPRSYRVDFSKGLTRLPGFQPQWTLERSAEEFNVWFAAGHSGGEPASSRRFVRLQQLKYLLADGQLDSTLRFVGQGG